MQQLFYPPPPSFSFHLGSENNTALITSFMRWDVTLNFLSKHLSRLTSYFASES